MNKKTLVSLLAMLLTSIHPAQAQQRGKVPRIGVLKTGTPPDANVDAFRQGLRELGYVEGKNIVFEYRRGGILIAGSSELVRLKVDVIFTTSTPTAMAAKNATTTIPIVVAGLSDPVATGLVASLARPGGNITG